MLNETVTGGAAERRTSCRRLLLVLVPVLLLAAALAPAPALAQDGGSTCSADVNATQDPTVANFSVDCGESNITRVRFDTTEDGSVEGDSGTQCSNVDQNTFECRPTGDASGVITGQFTNARGDAVCADPRLTIDFAVELEDGS